MRTPAQIRDFQPTVYGDSPTVPAALTPSFRREPLFGMSHVNRQAAFPEEPEAANAHRMKHRKLALERDIATFGERSRNAEQVRIAYRNGVTEGERAGFISGMHWGLTRGGVAGALLACLGVWLLRALKEWFA